MKAPILALFDCDGTLVDSQHIIFEAMSEAYAAVGHPVPIRSTVLSIVGLSLPQAMRRLMPHENESVHARMIEAYKGAFFRLRSQEVHKEPFFGGVEAVLERLGARDDVIIGIATGKSRRGVDSLFARTGIGRYFSTIQTADDAPSKPHPGMVLQACAETGIEPARCVMIGDTVFDMEMAQSAGAKSIAVTYGYHTVAALEACHPGALTDTILAVPDLVDRLVEETGAAG